MGPLASRGERPGTLPKRAAVPRAASTAASPVGERGAEQPSPGLPPQSPVGVGLPVAGVMFHRKLSRVPVAHGMKSEVLQTG